MGNGWLHNANTEQWELIHDEEVVASVTDEMIAGQPAPLLAGYLYRKIGSLPPPLSGYLPPNLPVIFEVEEDP